MIASTLSTDLNILDRSEASGKIYTPSDKAGYLLRDGLKMAHLFGKSARLAADPRAVAIADCLRETYQPQNIYTAKDLINYQTGELFDGYGALQNGVATRISKAYLTASARRQRKRITAKIAAVKMLVGHDWRFLTLTLPYLRSDVATVLKIESRATELFKKRKLWTENVAGAFFGEEMTIGDDSRIIYTHFHVHVHVLMLGKYIEQWQLADIWTDCVEKACAEFGVECLMRNTVSNRFMTDVRDVRKYARSREMTIDEAVQELCKYTTKGGDYEKVPVGEIVEIEKALHGRRMIKDYGCFNNQKGKANPTKAPNQKPGEQTSLDTKCTTDGAAQFKTKPPPSLLKRGIALIEAGRRVEWLRILRMELEQRRDYRRQQLAFKYPHAEFQTLDGARWFGVSKPPPQVVFSLDDYRARKGREFG